MDGDAGAHLAADAIAAARDAARLPTPSDDEECDDLYGDVNVGFLPLLPLSPSPSPTSPPKTPSPGHSPSPPPHSVPSPEPQPPPKPATSSGHQPPRPAPAPRHHMPPPPPQRAPRVDASSLPPSAAVYISELHWWTTDAEVEAALALALAPHAAAALLDLYFYADKYTGKSRGVCRADFLHRSAAASAAAALHGRAFHGRHCVASLSRPPALHRLGDDSDSSTEAPAQAPNPARGRGDGGRGRGASDATVVRANVGPVLGDRPAQAPLPPRSMAPRPRGLPFGGVMGGGGGGGGYGVLQSMGLFNAGMGTGMMPSVVAPHVNAAFLAAGGMAMRGPGMWHDQGIAGGLWGAPQPWNFRGYQVPWQQLTPPAQQRYGIGDYRNGRGMMRERLGSRSEERGIGNVRRQSDRDGGGDRYKEHGREDQRSRHRERVLEKERGREERFWDERDRHGDDKRRYQEYTDSDDFDRRGRARSRSQSRDGDDDDQPRRRH